MSEDAKQDQQQQEQGQEDAAKEPQTKEAEQVQAQGEPGGRDPGNQVSEPSDGGAQGPDGPVAEGETEVDEETAPPVEDGVPPLGEEPRGDEGQNGVREGDVWTDAKTGESVQVVSVSGDVATVARGNGDEEEISTNVLATTWRHDGPSHGWGEGSARA